MKVLFFFLISIFLGTTSWAQTNIPAAVKDAFSSKYPAAKSVKWEVEDEEFEAAFTLDGKNMDTSFDASGTWLATETEISKKVLPASVQQAITNGFSGYVIKEVEQLSTPRWANAYEVELKKGNEVLEIVFSNSGKVLEKKVDDDEDGDEEENEGN